MRTIKERLQNPYILLATIGAIAYGSIFLISSFYINYALGDKLLVEPPMTGSDARQFFIAFGIFAAPIIYFGDSWLAGKLLKIEFARAIFYMGLAMFLGCSLEIIVDHIFQLLLGRPCWNYHVWPIYNGHTSVITAVMWPLYGLHLYLFHLAMERRQSVLIQSIPVKGIMMAIDAMIMEMIANLFALIGFRSYYFYYLRGDLNHFTTIEIFLPYVIIGMGIMTIFHFFDKETFPRMALGFLLLIAGWVIIYLGL